MRDSSPIRLPVLALNGVASAPRRRPPLHNPRSAHEARAFPRPAVAPTYVQIQIHARGDATAYERLSSTPLDQGGATGEAAARVIELPPSSLPFPTLVTALRPDSLSLASSACLLLSQLFVAWVFALLTTPTWVLALSMVHSSMRPRLVHSLTHALPTDYAL